MKKRTIYTIFLFFVLQCIALNAAFSQISLQDLLASAYEETTIKQIKEINQKLNLEEKMINKSNFLPNLNIAGQLSYQSSVTSIDIPIPGIEIEELPKDQYKLIAEANQIIYDGGLIKQKNRIQEVAMDIQNSMLDAEFEILEQRITDFYFQILIFDAQRANLDYAYADLKQNTDLLHVLIENGMALKSELSHLSAKRLQLDQELIRIDAAKHSMIDALEILCHMTIAENAEFELPKSINQTDLNVQHLASFKILDYQRLLVDAELISKKRQLRPKASAFVQTGYGRPGLNFLNNEFEPFYIAGLRMNWNISPVYNLNRNQQKHTLNHLKIDKKEDLLREKLSIDIQQAEQQIRTLEALIENDEAQTKLYAEITETANDQFKNGLINLVELMRVQNQENVIRQNKVLHELKKTKVQYLLKELKGN